MLFFVAIGSDWKDVRPRFFPLVIVQMSLKDIHFSFVFICLCVALVAWEGLHSLLFFCLMFLRHLKSCIFSFAFIYFWFLDWKDVHPSFACTFFYESFFASPLFINHSWRGISEFKICISKVFPVAWCTNNTLITCRKMKANMCNRDTC